MQGQRIRQPVLDLMPTGRVRGYFEKGCYTLLTDDETTDQDSEVSTEYGSEDESSDSSKTIEWTAELRNNRPSTANEGSSESDSEEDSDEQEPLDTDEEEMEELNHPCLTLYGKCKCRYPPIATRREIDMMQSMPDPIMFRPRREECSICLQVMLKKAHSTYCMTCQKRFHYKCMTLWKTKAEDEMEKMKCPLCRAIWSQMELNISSRLCGSGPETVGGDVVQESE